MTDSTSPAPAAFAVPAGTTPEEIAAVAVVLMAASGGPEPNAAGSRTAWGEPGRSLRAPLTPGPRGWWSSTLPR